jgi:hypothetical protein
LGLLAPKDLREKKVTKVTEDLQVYTDLQAPLDLKVTVVLLALLDHLFRLVTANLFLLLALKRFVELYRKKSI